MAYARLITWQTTMDKSKGYKKAVVDTKFKHENVGHAAVELVLPVNEETTKLVNELCNPNNIPYYLIQHDVPTATVSYSGSQIRVASKAKSKEKEEKAHSEANYRIYFSFWPAQEDDETAEFSLNTPMEDFEEERSGNNFYNKYRNRDLINSDEIEIETYERGKFARKVLRKEEREYKLSPFIYHPNPSSNIERIYELQNQGRDLVTQLILNAHKPKEIKKIRKGAKETIDAFDSFFPDYHIRDKVDELLDKKRAETTKEAARFLTLVTLELNKGVRSRAYYNQLFHDTEGDQGDQVVTLPLTFATDGEEINPSALDARKMVEKMVEIVNNQETKYRIFGYNCSSAAGEVLHAGIQDRNLREKFNDTKKTRLLPITPQIALVRTLAIAGELQYDLKQVKKVAPITESIEMIAKQVTDENRRKMISLTKEELVSAKFSRKRLQAKDIKKLVKKMAAARKRDELLVPSEALNIEIIRIKTNLDKRRKQGKVLTQTQIELLEVCKKYEKEASKMLKAASLPRNVAMKKRKDDKIKMAKVAQKKAKAKLKAKTKAKKESKHNEKGKEKIGHKKTKPKKAKIPIMLSIGSSIGVEVKKPSPELSPGPSPKPSSVPSPDSSSSFITKRLYPYQSLRQNFENMAKEEKPEQASKTSSSKPRRS